ncbi:phosphoglycerate kinase [Solitalea sp. MAHUQ-68]|uniref:Phosphoglycerate kinase n=1 Tax=Solitalea agri TaxID=2953739 RepID=A0A9X2F1I7_9SPHI|nr:phosphoglycerate kinase [Solitalea agri]MCO4292440.1 phosphoglycerate kinase [Solitalea agri]
MKTIDNFNFSGKKALIRVDFNVPLNENFEITDDTRIQESAPTIKKILADGGMPIIMSHLGRPKGAEDKYSLKHVKDHVAKVMGAEVVFASDCIGEPAETAAASLKPGQILLLENLRFHKEEEAGDEAFAQQLAKLGDIYVNDAFGTAHRAHASTAIIAKFFPQAKCFGYLMAKEIVAIDKVLKNGEKPVTAVLGGSKVSSKITIINKMLDTVNNIIIGGGMTYTFVKAQGGKVGDSICEDDKMDLALDILKQAEAKGVKIFIPVDVLAADAFDNNANTKVVNVNEIPDGWQGLDAGPKTLASFAEVIKNSKTILWNGPLGVFEFENFSAGTKALGDAIGAATANGAFSLVGGGDSVAAVKQFGYQDKVSYVSTGGGAMLESLEGKELPGIKAVLE